MVFDFDPFRKGKLRHKLECRSYVTNVVMTAMILFSLIGCQAKSIKDQKEDVFCDPRNHQYYNYQIPGCKECDRCWKGQEPHLNGADVGMGIHGATKCPGCRDCGSGTYNPGGYRYWNCLTCTVCADLDMHEVQSCSPTRNTKCNKTVHARFVPRLYSYGYLQEALNLEGLKHNNQTAIGILSTVVGTGVVILIVYIMFRKLRNYRGNETERDTKESVPLQLQETQRPYGCDRQQQLQHLDNECPSDAGKRFLSTLLVTNEVFRDFAKHMGIENYQLKIIEDDYKKRKYDASYLSLQYMFKVFECKPKVTYSDIYEALALLGLKDDIAPLQQKRRNGDI